MQDTKDLDTLEANKALGHEDDCWNYTVAEAILTDLGVKEIILPMVSSQPKGANYVLWIQINIQLQTWKKKKQR